MKFLGVWELYFSLLDGFQRDVRVINEDPLCSPAGTVVTVWNSSLKFQIGLCQAISLNPWISSGLDIYGGIKRDEEDQATSSMLLVENKE